MPKSVVRELVEDSEEEQTQRTRRKSANKDDHEESSMDVDQTKKDEEEDEEEEEEYEIEQIIEFKAGVFDGGKGGYLVRWKGYGPEHDSWVTESDAENAQELITEFMGKTKKHGRDTLQAKSTKVRGRPRKSDADVKKSSPIQKRKRGRGSTISTRKSVPKEAEDDEEVQDIDNIESDEEPLKSTKKARSSSSRTPAKKNGQENGVKKLQPFEIDDEENQPVADYRPADEELFAKKSWEKLIKAVDTMEQLEGELQVFFTLNNGDRVFANSTQCRVRFPQKLLDFYERNLRWREVN